jgi:hypothetical protein
VRENVPYRKLLRVALAAITLAMALPVGASTAGAAPRIPTPAESVASLANRFGVAVTALETGDCQRWLIFQRSVRARSVPPCDEATHAAFANWQPTQVARYGTGAVITYISAGHPRGLTLSYLLGPGRRFVLVDTLDPERTPGVFAGTRSSIPFRIAINAVLSALRHRNCNLFWTRAVFFTNARPWTNLPGTGAKTKARACRAAFGPPQSPLVRDLMANPEVRPIHFGGTRNWHFFGLRTPSHYYNFVVARYGDQPGSRLKYFVDPPVRVF